MVADSCDLGIFYKVFIPFFFFFCFSREVGSVRVDLLRGQMLCSDQAGCSVESSHPFLSFHLDEYRGSNSCTYPLTYVVGSFFS